MALAHDTIVPLGSKLAPAAVTFGRLRTLPQNPATELEKIVNLVRLDPALTFHVIRMGHRVLFGLRARHDSLEGAVGRVGFQEICRLVGLAGTHQVGQRDLGPYRLPADRLWENAAARAAAEVLALPASDDAGLAYATGLPRTLGRVIIDGASGGYIYPGEAEWPDVSDWEKRTFGLTAAEVTTTLLSHWRFPSELIDSIRGDDAPLADTQSNTGACVRTSRVASPRASVWTCRVKLGTGCPMSRGLRSPA